MDDLLVRTVAGIGPRAELVGRGGAAPGLFLRRRRARRRGGRDNRRRGGRDNRRRPGPVHLLEARPDAIRSKTVQGDFPAALCVPSGWGCRWASSSSSSKRIRTPSNKAAARAVYGLPLHLLVERYYLPRQCRFLASNRQRTCSDTSPRGGPARSRGADDKGHRPLHRAVGHGAPLEVIRILLDAGPESVQHRTRAGDLPRRCACLRLPILQNLVELGPQSPRAATGNGKSPLHTWRCERRNRWRWYPTWSSSGRRPRGGPTTTAGCRSTSHRVSRPWT
jgi:hypothetical protein